MKNLLLAILIAIALVNCLGALFSDWWGVHLVMADELLSPMESILAFSVVAVVFVVVGFIVAVSLAGTIFIGLAAGLLTVFVIGISALWPLLLIAGVVYLIRRSRHSYASQH